MADASGVPAKPGGTAGPVPIWPAPVADAAGGLAATPRVRVPFFYGWVIVFVAGMLGFVGTGFYSYARGVFLPHLTEAYGEGTQLVAWGFSAAGVVGAFIAPWLGGILDRVSARRIILIGVCIVAIGYWLLARTTALWQFYVVVGLCMGVGTSCMGNFTWHRVLVSWFERQRGLALSLAVGGASLAGVVMPFFATWLTLLLGWRTAFVIFGVITAAVLLPLVWWLLHDRPSDIGEQVDGGQRGSVAVDAEGERHNARVWTLRQMLATPAFWAIALIFGVMGCIFSVVMLHLYKHALNVGLSEYQAATVSSAVAAMSLAGKPAFGWIADAFGGRVAIWLSLLLHAVGLTALAFADGFVMAVGAAGLYGLGMSGMSPLRAFAIAASFGRTSFPQVNGYLRPVQLPFELTASPFAGFIYDAFGSYRLAFLFLVAVVVLAMLGPFFIAAGGAREKAARLRAGATG